MTETQSTSVSEFITRCIESAGGIVEVRSSEILDALLADGLAGAAGGRVVVSLALTADALSAVRDAEPAAIGSPFLDVLIRFASGRGTTAMGRLNPGIVKRKGLREALEEELTFANCRVRFEDTSIRIRDSHYILFDFRLTYISDERRERLATIPVDVESNRVNGRLGELLPKLRLTPTDPPAAGAVGAASIAAAYETAKQTVAIRAREEGLGYQGRLVKRFEVEQARISDYYGQIGRDLMRRADGEPHGEKREALIAKREVARKEEQVKIREIGEKYRIRPHVALASARLVAQEKTYFTVQIDRGPITRPFELRYDSLLQRIEPPACEKCARETVRVYVNSDGLRLCPACAGKD